MAEVITRTEEGVRVRGSSMDWSAIWAGLFTFAAIWSVFAYLGYSIFYSASSATATQPGSGGSMALGIWLVILTIIAMYVAGTATGRVAGLDGRFQAALHGMVMFGLSIVTVLVLAASGNLVNSGSANRAIDYYTGFFGSGWATFFALLLGWLGAMAGASSAVRSSPALPEGRDTGVTDIRRAA